LALVSNPKLVSARLEPLSHAGERTDDVTEALAEDAARARSVVTEELPRLQADDHALALHREVAHTAGVAGVHAPRYDTAFRAGASHGGSHELEAVPSREALCAAAHQQVFVGEEADEARATGGHYKYDAV
jgi:hypothetical protein